jgi:histidinol-phosphate aminotransferase
MEVREALDLVSRPVRELSPYHLVPETVPVKLNQNENPFDWPLPIKEEVAAFVRERPWNRYPPFIPDELRAALGESVGMSAGNVIVGNGSNEMLLVLLMAFAGPDVPVTICQPTFSVYNLLIRALHSKLNSVSARPDLSFDVPAIIEAVRRLPRSLLLLCSPNNPTGASLKQEDISRILEAHTGFCILDQAYVEFGGFNALPLLERHPNIVVTRTYSKAFAGAGLRMGYMIGNKDIIAELNKVKLPYNINFFTEHVARVLLSHRDIAAQRVAEIVASRGDMYSFLRTLPFIAVYPSDANFILVRVDGKERLFAHLKDNGILIRDYSSYPMLENCLRISIGSKSENDLLKAALRSFFGKGA